MIAVVILALSVMVLIVLAIIGFVVMVSAVRIMWRGYKAAKVNESDSHSHR